MNKRLWIAGGLALAAGMAYFLDPRAGTRRRNMFRDRTAGTARRVARAAGKAGRDLRNRVDGVVASLEQRFRREEPTPEQLAERVRARIGHVLSHPEGIEVFADRSGMVILEGPISANEREHVLGEVRKVHGVRDVLDRFEVRDTGIPMLQASGRTSMPSARPSPALQLVSVVGGSALLLAGLAKRGKAGSALGLAGASLLARGVHPRLVRKLRRMA